MTKYHELILQMTLEEKCYLLSGIDFWSTRSYQHLNIPGMTMSDGPHGVRRQEGPGDQLGLNKSLQATCYPTAAAMANSWDTALCQEMAACLGEEAACQGVHVLLGPGMNLKRSPLCGRNFEYFSEDPYLTGKLAASYIKGIQSNGVAACPKHFAANSQELRRMSCDSIVDERTLRELYLTAFEIAVKEAHPLAIMSSYNRINGVYASENRHLLHEILKVEWGFEGYTVTDWGGSNDHTAGVLAGTHLEMPTCGGDSDIQLIEAVKSGDISEDWLNQMVDELLSVIFHTTDAIRQKYGKSFNIEAHHTMAEIAAAQSAVLLKNDDSILPLSAGAKIVLIGDFAQFPRYQGAGSSAVNPTKLDSLTSVVENYAFEYMGFANGYSRNGHIYPKLEQEACELAKKAEVVLLCIGLTEISESEGLDRQHMKLPDNQIHLLQSLAEVNPNIVVLFSAGSAVEMPWINNCKALIHGYLYGQAGANAMLKIVTGQVNPSGKLAESYPLKYESVPSAPYFPSRERTTEYRESMFVGYRYYDTAHIPVQFPFGYGLSYTTFKYSHLRLTDNTATFTLTNIGKTDGAEIAQLYVSAKCKRVFRPFKELKGFTKVFLTAGESKEVTIPLDHTAFRYFNIKTNRFEIEDGEYLILIGASSADIRLSDTLYVQGTGAHSPYHPDQLPSYYSCNITNVPDKEFAALLGHPIPSGNWTSSGLLDINDALCQMYYAKSALARFVYKVMTHMLKKAEKKGKPNLNILFIYNMPFRGIAKMTGGMVTLEMAEGILAMVNGHFFQGFGTIVGGFFRGRKKRKQASLINKL